MSSPPPDAQPPAHEAAARRDWVAYFDRMAGKPARETLTGALDAFGAVAPSAPPFAVDLGAGDGRDTAVMLERGWRVLAHDGHAEGLRRLRHRPACAAALAEGRLEVVHADFADIEIPPANLVNASFSLPFCPPDAFPALWRKIDAALAPGARFSGQLFGDRDEWINLGGLTHLTRAQALDLFSDYVLESFREEDRPSTHKGEAHKHWHTFHIIARKRSESQTGER